MKKLLFLTFFLLAGLAALAQDQITNIPTLYINTNGVSITSKENYVPGTVTVASDDAEVAITDVSMGIRGRGNSTWGMAKKPYRIKFDKKINFLNQNAKAKSWVLLANYADKTLMRNGVAFEISRFIDLEFSPSAVFVDVVLNGQYLGNYMVSDQMQVGAGRVDIDEMDETNISGEELTGGYFMEIDGFGDSEPVHFTTNHGLLITLKSPDEELVQQVQIDYIKNFVNTFESKLFASNFTDPELGYRSMVDEHSLINWYIACELTGNSDSFWSTYIYKKRNDNHLYFGPLWDFDIAFNNDNRIQNAPTRLMRDAGHGYKQWIGRLWQDPWFRQAVWERWRELTKAGIEEHLINYIDQTAAAIDQSQAKNFEKWPVLNQRVYDEVYLFKTYKEGVDYLRSYVIDRVAFLTQSFKATGEVSCINNIADGAEYYIQHYNGLYATPEASNFYIENPDPDRQKLTFVSAGDGIWNIRTYDGRLVASKDGDKYCTYITDGTDKHAQYTVEASQYDGYAKIKNLHTNQYLGIENQAHMSRISTNKDGTQTNHAWKITLAGVSTKDLEDQIAKAEEALAGAHVGDQLGDYPQEAVDALTQAIAEATEALSSDDADEIDAATEALSEALAAFLESRILSNESITVDEDTFVADPQALDFGASYDIVGDETLLVFENVKPLDVLAHAAQLSVDGKPMVVDQNARISIYKQGTALMAHTPEYAALTAYSAPDFAGESSTLLPEFYYSDAPSTYVAEANKKPLPLDGNIQSFVLKRGYMATLATEPDGMGYSQIFIADKYDVEISELPAEFDGKVMFVRVLPWQWTSKKGWVGGNSNENNPEGFIEDQSDVTNSTWVYTWGPNADWARRPVNRGTAWRNQEFVPQKWGYGGDGDWRTIFNQSGSNHLLGYNEPDHSEQSNVGVDKAITEWPLFQQTGLRLGTPSTTDFWWLYDFLDKALKKGYRVDFAAIHAYWGGSGGSVVVNGIADWAAKLSEIHERTGLPIWITEWNNGANWTHEAWPSTEAEQQEKQRQFIVDILALFDEMDYMERYSIYNWVENKRSMFHGNLNLTPAGQAYADFNADFAYQSPDKQGEPDGIADAKSGALVYDPACGIVKTDAPAVIEVYSTDGRLVVRSAYPTHVSVASLPTGIYVARAGSQAIKFAK